MRVPNLQTLQQAEAVCTDTLMNLDGVSEAVVLSTCNRTEQYLAGGDQSAAHAALASFGISGRPPRSGVDTRRVAC